MPMVRDPTLCALRVRTPQIWKSMPGNVDVEQFRGSTDAFTANLIIPFCKSQRAQHDLKQQLRLSGPETAVSTLASKHNGLHGLSTSTIRAQPSSYRYSLPTRRNTIALLTYSQP